MKSIHPETKIVQFFCVSCDSTYQSYSTFKGSSKISVGTCANCHHVYTGQSVSGIRTGNVEKFKARERKSRKIIEAKQKS